MYLLSGAISPSHHDKAIPIVSPLLFMHVGHPYIPLFKIRRMFECNNCLMPASPCVGTNYSVESLLRDDGRAILGLEKAVLTLELGCVCGLGMPELLSVCCKAG